MISQNINMGLDSLVEEAVVEAIKNYLDKKEPPNTSNYLDLIFPAERYTHSIMTGLLTSLGTTLWEKISKKIAAHNNFEVLDEKKFNKNTKKGEGIDLWVKKENREYMYDIKTVLLNAGSGVKNSQNLDSWRHYRLLECPDVDLSTSIVFPYNPYPSYEIYLKKEKGKIAPLILGETALLGDQFWNFIFGKDDSMNLIFEVLRKIGASNKLDHLKKKFYR